MSRNGANVDIFRDRFEHLSRMAGYGLRISIPHRILSVVIKLIQFHNQVCGIVMVITIKIITIMKTAARI